MPNFSQIFEVYSGHDGAGIIIGFCSVGVSQSQFFYVVSALQFLYSGYFWLIGLYQILRKFAALSFAVLCLFYVQFMFFGTLYRSDMLSFFSMVLSMRSNVQMVLSIYIFFARHQHDTLSSLPPGTRDVAARDSGDKRVQRYGTRYRERVNFAIKLR